MSWQTYVGAHLLCDIDGQQLKVAAILSHDGSVWAQSPAFPEGTGGITIKTSVLALITGIYDEAMTGGQCNMVVERLGDYLYDQGF